MEFNLVILEKLGTFLALQGLQVVEESKNIVKYENERYFIKFVYNARENSYSLCVGGKCFNEIEIDNQLMREYYKSDLKLGQLKLDNFVSNVVLFFVSYGKKLLDADDNAIVDLERYYKQRSSRYTTMLIEEQNLVAANKAWENKNYLDVIKFAENIDKRNMPKSLKMKYDIARKRISADC